LCLAVSFRNRRHKRCWALSAIAITRPGGPSAAAPGRAHAGAMLVMPRGFDPQAPDQGVAGPRDRAAAARRSSIRPAPPPHRPSRPGLWGTAPRGYLREDQHR
jgi:hypothetical protein